jgi:hypothetical protein
MMVMLGAFFSWWYGRGWMQVATSFRPRLRGVLNAFSVNQLLRTLFEPWRRIVTEPGASLDNRVRALVDNVFSRAIGFVVRIFVLFAAFVTLLTVLLLTIIEVVLWPLLPPAIPGCLVAGLII